MIRKGTTFGWAETDASGFVRVDIKVNARKVIRDCIGTFRLVPDSW